MTDISEEVKWDESALKELNKLSFMRKAVKSMIEGRARMDGINMITIDYLRKHTNTVDKVKHNEVMNKIVSRVVGIIAIGVLILALYYLYFPAMFIVISKETDMLLFMSSALAYTMGAVIIWSLKVKKIVRISLFGFALSLVIGVALIYSYVSHMYGMIISAITFIAAVILSGWRLLFVRR